jgi:hypothetical protein
VDYDYITFVSLIRINPGTGRVDAVEPIGYIRLIVLVTNTREGFPT